MGLTKAVLKRPVTTVLVILCLIVFGLMSVFSSKMELMPAMDMPMMVIAAVYPGASPDDVTELVTKPIEDAVGTLSGIDGVTSYSAENMSMVLLEYEYGTDMDQSYDDLKKQMDNLDLPDDVDTPSIISFNINDTASMMLSVNNSETNNLYNYVNDELVPELERLSSVANIETSGGQEQYIQVEIIPEKLNQYHLSMNSLVTALASSSLSYPAGSTEVGNQSLSVTTGMEFDTVDSLKSIPITVGSGDVIYLEDVANVGYALDDATAIGRYNGQDTMTISLQKQQDASAMEMADDVNGAVSQLVANTPGLEVTTIYDASDNIQSSLSSVYQTMIMAVIISMVIILLFFGEIKASLIVGTSIPISILSALILMSLMGFSLNVITLGSLVLGVGMMVDNSIVVLESCFRATDKVGLKEYYKAALDGTGVVINSIIGSTATTCVVFLPLAFLDGLSGQMFKPLGFTIVFCMVASLVSAMTVVPLCYMFYRPKEKETAPLSGWVRWLQNGYRRIMEKLLPRKKTVMFTTIGLLALSILAATQLRFELIPEVDEGQIAVTVDMRPGLTLDRADAILREVEAYITQDPDLDSYSLSYGGSGMTSLTGGSGASITAYLKDDRSRETDDIAREWNRHLATFADCNASAEVSSTMSMMTTSNDSVDFILESTDYDELKEASNRIVEQMQDRTDVTDVHSTLENSAPLVKINVDPIKATAEGLSPAQIGATVNNMLSGVEATTLEVDGEDVSVMVEYPKDEYKTIDQVQGIVLTNAMGQSVALTDVADVVFEDSPQSIVRSDKQYQVTISADYTDQANSNRTAARQALATEVVNPNMTVNIHTAANAVDEMMVEEFTALIQAIAIAVFLVFVVMAAQFESYKFSFMVMTTIPFSLIGAFGFLWIADASISMPSLLGFLMLAGTVVNNGILYVDTVNQYRREMDMKTALIEAGATRLRPILMTTLTTVISMVPMCLAYGDSGEMMQGLALVNVGGLTASTILSLLMLPVYYTLMNRQKKQVVWNDD